MDGQPLFHLETSTLDSAVALARVSSFDYLIKVLEIAEENRLKEIQEIIQGKLV
jgi:hypothetical protein